MSKKAIILLSTILFSQALFAESCPSVATIKANKITDWKAFDSDDGKPLSEKRLTQFKTTVQQFVLAEWSNINNKKSTIHCYYRDKEGYSFEAYLAKDNFKPENSHKIWYSVSGSMQCAADMEKCQFSNLLSAPKQLAKR